jgi:hypothetical protein
MFSVCACVCVFLCLCTGRGLATSWSPVQGVLPSVPDQETEETQPYAPKTGASSSVGATRKKEKKSSWGVGWDWVHLVRRPLTGLLYQPRTTDECGAVGGMRIGRRNRSTRRKPTPVPLCPPQIPHDLTWARTRAAAVRSRRLTAWAMARPFKR